MNKKETLDQQRRKDSHTQAQKIQILINHKRALSESFKRLGRDASTLVRETLTLVPPCNWDFMFFGSISPSSNGDFEFSIQICPDYWWKSLKFWVQPALHFLALDLFYFHRWVSLISAFCLSINFDEKQCVFSLNICDFLGAFSFVCWWCEFRPVLFGKHLEDLSFPSRCSLPFWVVIHIFLVLFCAPFSSLLVFKDSSLVSLTTCSPGVFSLGAILSFVYCLNLGVTQILYWR